MDITDMVQAQLEAEAKADARPKKRLVLHVEGTYEIFGVENEELLPGGTPIPIVHTDYPGVIFDPAVVTPRSVIYRSRPKLEVEQADS